MQQFPHYVLNASNGDQTNQYNMNTVDMNNVLKSFIENNNSALAQNLSGQQDNSSYFQHNKVPASCLIQINPYGVPQQYMQMVQLPPGNPVYLNQQFQFPGGDQGAQYNLPQLLQMHQMQPNIIQVDVGDLTGKAGHQNNGLTGSRPRKKAYMGQPKVEPGLNHEVVMAGDVPCDNKNRPLAYSCNECSRKFSMQSRLTQHKKCHSGTRPFECPVCRFAFTQKSYLIRHAAVHKEERPYMCQLCQKTYKHYGSLANHRKTHKNGNKTLDRSSEIVDTNGTNENISSGCKIEGEMLDMNNNNLAGGYIPITSAEYLIQNSQQLDHHQPFSTQYGSDIPTAAQFSNSFQNFLTSSQSADIGVNFLNQLGSLYSSLPNNNNISSGTNCDMKTELQLHDQPLDPISSNNSATTNPSNNPSISADHPQPVSLNQSSPSITSFTV